MDLHTCIQLFIVAALVLFVSGCAADPSPLEAAVPDGVATVKVSGVGQRLSVSHPGLFDLEVSGDAHTVTVPTGNTVRTLLLSGTHHCIRVADGASVQSIRLSGVDTTIHLPKSLHPTVTGSGIGSRILNEFDGRDLPAQRVCRTPNAARSQSGEVPNGDGVGLYDDVSRATVHRLVAG